MVFQCRTDPVPWSWAPWSWAEVWIKEKAPKAKDVNLQAGKPQLAVLPWYFYAVRTSRSARQKHMHPMKRHQAFLGLERSLSVMLAETR